MAETMSTWAECDEEGCDFRLWLHDDDVAEYVADDFYAGLAPVTEQKAAFLRHREETGHEDVCISEGHIERAVVTLCGSVRFREDFDRANERFTLAGVVVLAPGCWDHDWLHQPEHNAELTKDGLDDLHRDKIDLSDFIYVLNRDGYIGKSTRAEIEYAERTGKPVLYMEEPGVVRAD